MKRIGSVVAVLTAVACGAVAQALPEGWIDAPFGVYTPGLEGVSWFDGADTVTVTGSGQGMGGSTPNSEGGRYVFRRLRGDAEIVADVPFQDRVALNDSARAGLMFRSSGDRHDRFIGLMREPGSAAETGRLRFQYRVSQWANSGSQTPVAGVSQGNNYLYGYDMPVIRMRLVRLGNRVNGYLSTNETETAWFKAFERDVPLGEDVLAGVFVSRAAVRQVEIMTNVFANVTVRELVSAERDAAGERRVVTWATDLSDAPEGASYRLSYSTSSTGTFTLLADDAVTPYETEANWLVGTPLYFRVEYVTEGATNLLGTSGACALRRAQPGRAAPAANGLWAAYYAPADAAAPLAERLESIVGDNWTNTVAGLGTENFRVVFNGSVTPAESDLYVFGSEADDTVRVTLDTAALIEDIYANVNGSVDFSMPVWLEAGRSYGLRVDYAQATGDRRIALHWARRGDTAFAPVPTEALEPFPLPWMHMDIGAVDVGGYAAYDWDAGAFTVAGTGTESGGVDGSFRYVWREQSGDFDYSTRLRLAEANNARAAAGVLMRASQASAPIQAGIWLIEGEETVQVEVRYRAAEGAAVQTVAGPSFAKGLPVYFGISRSGDRFAFRYRTNGDWSELAQLALLLPDTLLLGMAAASQDPLQPVEAVFDETQARAYPAVALAAEADAYVDNGNRAENYGSVTNLFIKRFNASGTREALVRFDASRFGEARSAKLMLYVLVKNAGLPSETVAARLLRDSRWPEASVTWDAPPTDVSLPSAHIDPLDRVFAGRGLVPPVGGWLEIDVTEAFNRVTQGDGRLSLLLSSQVTHNGSVLSLASRESSNAGLQPKLVVVPLAPARPAARMAAGTEARVTWEAFPEATAYRVWRADGAEAGFAQVSGDLTETAFSDSGLTAGRLYRYAVTAVTADGETPLSPPAAMAASAGQTVSVTPIADAYVRGGSYTQTAYGATDSSNLTVKNLGWSNGNNAREAFVRFDTTGWSGAEQAILSLTVKSSDGSSPAGVPRRADVWLAPDSDWDEQSITWDNPPAGVSLPITKAFVPEEGKAARFEVVPNTNNSNILVDVTAMVRAAARTGGGKMTLGISRNDTDSGNNLGFYSKEQTGGALNYIPKLTVVSVRPGVPEVVDAAGGVGLAWPAFRGALSYTLRHAEGPGGPYAVIAEGLTETAFTAAVTAGWFTVSAVAADGETPPSGPVYGEMAAAYIRRLPVADTYTESGGNADVNYGQAAELRIKSTSMSPAREQFFRFDVAGLERAASARLRLNTWYTDTSVMPSHILVYSEDVGEWNEHIVTWNTPIPGLTRPFSNTAVRAPNEVARIFYPTYDSGRQTFIEADVTEVVRAAAAAGRQPTFCLAGENATAQAPLVWYTASKEHATEAQWPALLAEVGVFGAPTAARVIRDEIGRAATLTWTAVPGAASYTVRRVLADGGREEVAAGLTETSWALSGLWSNGTTYTYEVVAVGAGGTESEAAVLEVALDRTHVAPAVADTYIRGGEYSGGVYGAEAALQVKRDDSLPLNREAYLRFGLGGLPAFMRARLRLYVSGVNNTDMTLVAQAVAETGWSETGEAALTWATAPATRPADPGAPAAGELWRGSVLGSVVGTVVEADVTAGLEAWLAQNPGAESLVVHVFSADQDASGAKQIGFASKEGAMFPDQAPAMVFLLAAYPPQGSVMILK